VESVDQMDSRHDFDPGSGRAHVSRKGGMTPPPPVVDSESGSPEEPEDSRSPRVNVVSGRQICFCALSSCLSGVLIVRASISFLVVELRFGVGAHKPLSARIECCLFNDRGGIVDLNPSGSSLRRNISLQAARETASTFVRGGGEDTIVRNSSEKKHRDILELKFIKFHPTSINVRYAKLPMPTHEAGCCRPLRLSFYPACPTSSIRSDPRYPPKIASGPTASSQHNVLRPRVCTCIVRHVLNLGVRHAYLLCSHSCILLVLLAFRPARPFALVFGASFP